MTSPMIENPGIGTVERDVFQDVRLSTTTKALYGLLTTYADQDRCASVSRKQLAHDLRISLPTLDKVIQAGSLHDPWLWDVVAQKYDDGRAAENLFVLRDFAFGYLPQTEKLDAVSYGKPTPVTPVPRGRGRREPQMRVKKSWLR